MECHQRHGSEAGIDRISIAHQRDRFEVCLQLHAQRWKFSLLVFRVINGLLSCWGIRSHPHNLILKRIGKFSGSADKLRQVGQPLLIVFALLLLMHSLQIRFSDNSFNQICELPRAGHQILLCF